MPWDSSKTPAELDKISAANKKYLDSKKEPSKPTGPTKPYSASNSSFGSSGPIKGAKGYKAPTAAEKAAKDKARDERASRATTAFGPGNNTVKMTSAAQRRSGGKTFGSSTPITSPSAPRIKPAPASTKTATKTASPKAALVSRMKAADRRERVRSGDYKGKFYGPDAFKGNLSKIDAWKKAGKPDISAFLKKK